MNIDYANFNWRTLRFYCLKVGVQFGHCFKWLLVLAVVLHVNTAGSRLVCFCWVEVLAHICCSVGYLSVSTGWLLCCLAVLSLLGGCWKAVAVWLLVGWHWLEGWAVPGKSLAGLIGLGRCLGITFWMFVFTSVFAVGRFFGGFAGSGWVAAVSLSWLSVLAASRLLLAGCRAVWLLCPFSVLWPSLASLGGGGCCVLDVLSHCHKIAALVMFLFERMGWCWGWSWQEWMGYLCWFAVSALFLVCWMNGGYCWVFAELSGGAVSVIFYGVGRFLEALLVQGGGSWGPSVWLAVLVGKLPLGLRCKCCGWVKWVEVWCRNCLGAGIDLSLPPFTCMPSFWGGMILWRRMLTMVSIAPSLKLVVMILNWCCGWLTGTRMNQIAGNKGSIESCGGGEDWSASDVLVD